MGRTKVAPWLASAIDSRISRSSPGAALRTLGFGLFPSHPYPLSRRKKRSGADLRLLLGALLAEINIRTKEARGVGVGRSRGPPGPQPQHWVSKEAVVMAAGCSTFWQQDAPSSALGCLWALPVEEGKAGGSGGRPFSGSGCTSARLSLNIHTRTHTHTPFPGQSLKEPSFQRVQGRDGLNG